MRRLMPCRLRSATAASKSFANRNPIGPGKYTTFRRPMSGAIIACDRPMGSTIGGRAFVPFRFGTSTSTCRAFSPLASAFRRLYVRPTLNGGIDGGRHSVPSTASSISPGLIPATWAGPPSKTSKKNQRSDPATEKPRSVALIECWGRTSFPYS
jgi:hypothetical protein